MNYIFETAGYVENIPLSDEDMSFFEVLCDLGVVNTTQFDLLYYVTHHYPTKVASSILSKWSDYSGVIHKRKKSIRKVNWK